jgi:hypothetical protein
MSKGRKWFGYIFTSIQILGISILLILNSPDAFSGASMYLISGLIIVYLIFTAANIVKSAIVSKNFVPELSDKIVQSIKGEENET